MDPSVRRFPLLTSGQTHRLDMYFMTHPWAKPTLAIGIAVIFIILAYFIGRGFGGSKPESFSMKEGPIKYVDRPGQTIVKTVEVPIPGQIPGGGLLSYNGSNAYLIGGWGDNLHWDGHGVVPVHGRITIKVDPANNIGSVMAEFPNATINSEDRTYLSGNVRIEFTVFHGIEPYQNGGITNQVELFGNTGKEGDILPRVAADLAGWGTAEVLLDGQSVYSKLPSFFMVNDALRDDDNAISLPDGTIYSPRFSNKEGFSDPRAKEITLMVHSADTDKKNKPPVSVFIHAVFKDVQH